MSTNDKDISMQSSVLEKYVKQPLQLTDSEPIITDCYTELPTHVAMLNLVDKAGDQVALPYHCLGQVRFKRSGQITLHFHNQQVNITGRSMQALYAGLIGHRISRVEPRLRSELVGGDQVVVTKIIIKQVEPLC